MTESLDDLIASALDPTRSVVVEACAGSGKTWLLASRILRLLLAGVAPGEILAITFTRKAAREIEARVVDWLRLLATGSAAEVRQFLAERHVDEHVDDCAAASTLQLARSLYERVVAAQPGLGVNTFHGWFLQLVAAAPLSANLAGATLVDSDARLFDTLWQSFAAELQKDASTGLSGSFIYLLGEAGLASTRRLVQRGMSRRSEWLTFTEAQGDPLQHVLATLRSHLGVSEDAVALNAFFADDWALDFHAYLGMLEMSELDTDRKLAGCLAAALAEGMATDPASCFAGLREALLTKSDTLRARKPSKALDKRFGGDGARRLLDLHARLGGRVLDCLARQLEERIYRFNEHAGRVLQGFLAHVEAFKAARRQIDFVDAEWRVLQLLRDEQTAAFLQARLDARYSHVLLDEFQDTNPLQWQILLAWLGAYSDGARPTVFLVGDPKQSIYRFRRAEPKLFAAAAAFLQDEYGARRCEQDTTRRNAQAIIDVVNALFVDEPVFAPFRRQQSLTGALPGCVELLPLLDADDPPDADAGREANEAGEPLRDPLREAAREAVDSRRCREAARLAERIAAMVGSWLIDERDGNGQITQRPLHYGDIMFLTRSRGKLAEVERALGEAGIPFAAASRGGLLSTLEARDIVALLEFLVMPVADLQLAQALRSPIFACSDADLLCLAARPEGSWWQRLQSVAGEAAEAGAGSMLPRLTRAAALLADWLAAADRLPAHDLLDRIYHQGEVLARYRQAVPAAACASVEANLHAFLLLALDLDGGRYPSLPRFIDELRELRDLRDAAAGDAPDEGAIVVPGHDQGRVRILTIHGAKGLESPVVWLLDANAPARPEEAWDILVDWPPQASRPQHFSFYGRMPERGAARQALFEQESEAARREELNLLYVAITRARQVFIASGIAGTRDSDDTPYRRLEAALDKLGGGLQHGDALAQLPAPHPLSSAPAVADGSDDKPLPPIGQRRSPPGAGERFGILLHALLERRTGRHADADWWRGLGFNEAEYCRVLPVAERLLAAPALQRFFDAAQFCRAWNEIEIAGPDGQLLRVDRLVEFADALWVLDYKSSSADTPHLDSYRTQVTDYCEAVAAVFPGVPVYGALVFTDASLLEVIRLCGRAGVSDLPER